MISSLLGHQLLPTPRLPLFHPAKLIVHPETAQDREQHTYLLRIGVEVFPELIQLIGDRKWFFNR